MELLLLGPVELRVGGQPVALGVRQQRGALVMLALDRAREFGLAEDPGYALDGLAAAAAALGQPERAARLIGAADAVFRAVEIRPQQFEADRRDEVLSQLREELGPEALAAAMAQGATRIAPSPLTAGPGAGRT